MNVDSILSCKGLCQVLHNFWEYLQLLAHNFPWNFTQNLSRRESYMFQNAVWGTYDGRWPLWGESNSEGFLRFWVEKGQDDCKSFSNPSRHSSCLLIHCSFVFYFHARWLNRRDIFVFGSWHIGWSFQSFLEVVFRHLFWVFSRKMVVELYEVFSKFIDWWESSFLKLIGKVCWTIS